MLELIISAIGLGIMLSLVLIGPVFFLLIETSLRRGYKHALALDFGVITADILCIAIACYFSYDLVQLIDKNPVFYKITAFMILIYGLVMVMSKNKKHINEDAVVGKNYLKTFFNGFMLNMINIGVVVFWLVTVISLRARYPQDNKFFAYIGIVIATFFAIDLLKIYLAQSFQKKITDENIAMVRKIVGYILMIFSVFIFLKSIGMIDASINKEIEKRTRS